MSTSSCTTFTFELSSEPCTAVQGSLESSNVNVVQELVDMIETQRAYEVSSKTITSVDEMMRYLAQNV